MDGDRFRAGSLDVVAGGDVEASWTLVGEGEAFSLDGLATEVVGALPGGEAAEHPNGVTGVDHVVIATPAIDRTAAAFEAAGMPIRRERDAGAFLQRFLRLGEVVVEIIGPPGGEGSGPASVWGVTFTAPDLDRVAAAAASHGLPLGEAHDAVQPGRRIVSVPREAGVSLPVAFITPR